MELEGLGGKGVCMGLTTFFLKAFSTCETTA